MTAVHRTEAGPAMVPCAASGAAGGGYYVHPEGVCACFSGGPAPIWVPLPERTLLHNRPGVFDTSWVGQESPKLRRPRRVTARGRDLLGSLRRSALALVKRG
jgi:hypothetical protein